MNDYKCSDMMLSLVQSQLSRSNCSDQGQNVKVQTLTLIIEVMSITKPRGQDYNDSWLIFGLPIGRFGHTGVINGFKRIWVRIS